MVITHLLQLRYPGLVWVILLLLLLPAGMLLVLPGGWVRVRMARRVARLGSGKTAVKIRRRRRGGGGRGC